MKTNADSQSKRVLKESTLRYRINTHLAEHEQLMIIRAGCRFGPVFVLDLTTGKVADRNLRSMAALARKRGLVARWETTK